MADIEAWIAELREGLAGVTDGPWTHCETCKCTTISCPDHPVADVVKGEWGDEFPSLRFKEGGPGQLGETSVEAYIERFAYGEIAEETAMRNRAHIARCSPDRIRALLDRLDELTAEREGWAERIIAQYGTTVDTLSARLEEAVRERDAKEQAIREEVAKYRAIWESMESWRARAESASLQATEAQRRLDRLTAALAWLDTYEPELVTRAEEKFGFSLVPAPLPTPSEPDARTIPPLDTRISDETKAELAEIDAAQRTFAQQASSILVGSSEPDALVERLRHALDRCDYTLSVHGHIDAETDLHKLIRSVLSEAPCKGS